MTVVGARPQFIKAAVVSRQIQKQQQLDGSISEVLVHTGQHFDHNMSQAFFDELQIPAPAHNLAVHGSTHGVMTGLMMQKLDPIIEQERPDVMLVYGDTNSTLAGALCASKMSIPVVHVEAGLRSFNRAMPEEINRVMTDHLSSLLLCPTNLAVDNLAKEGIQKGVYNCGDVMYDSFLYFATQPTSSSIIETLKLTKKRFILATCHRAESTDNKEILQSIFAALNELAGEMPVVLPIHPRTKQKLIQYGLESLLNGLTVIPPASYTDTVQLLNHAFAVVTDSGGLQKEAYFARTPCITIRPQTEWIETLQSGYNQLCDYDKGAIIHKVLNPIDEPKWTPFYGEGNAGERIVDLMLKNTV